MNFINFHEEISFLSMIFLGSIFFLLSIKKNSLFINFNFLFIPLIILINVLNSFNLFINKKDFKYPIFSEKEYFNNKQYEKILLNNKNKNIYYILLDGAIDLDDIDNKISISEKKKISSDLKVLGLEKIKVRSNYLNDTLDLNTITISEMFNLQKFENMKDVNLSDDNVDLLKQIEDFKIANIISSEATFPNILNNFYLTSLGKTLQKINYNFFWVGSVNSNCIYFNSSFCLDDKLKFMSKLKYFLKFENFYKSNYVIRNYFHLTPLIKINNKLNQISFFDTLEKNDAQYQIDSINRFIKNFKVNKKNSFNFINFGLPNIYITNNNIPITFSSDCILKKNQGLIDSTFSFRTVNRLHYLNEDEFYDAYLSNYYCMIKRIKEFMEFINLNDPTGIIVFQSSYNYPVVRKETKKDNFNLLTYIKASKFCKQYLNKDLNNINIVRLLLSCATEQKFYPYKSKNL